jgi:hypothetical protein
VINSLGHAVLEATDHKPVPQTPLVSFNDTYVVKAEQPARSEIRESFVMVAMLRQHSV